ncbi:uncharacterized protein LOC132087692 [Daphnia carinata]|uniref:uncharacterized protein LOC132087692 n=1 Tax=Daphnia carinata TaxID=120202 RepID=UPI00257B69E4|nr:uncharacterized protein LOC132087692 [Daphnia carinata]
MRVTTPLLALFAACLVGPIANFGRAVQAVPFVDRLQEMTAAIQPSFSEALVHLSNLFDLVMNYDDTVANGSMDNAATISIQTAIRLASNSLNDTEAITVHHIKLYEANLLSLATDISAKEEQLRNDNTELERLTIEVMKWQGEAEKLGQEIAELDNKVRDADQRAAHSQARVQRRRKNRWKWIAATVVTGGLAAPGLVLNERDIQKLKRDRDAWQAQANERRQLLQVADNNLREITTRQKATEESIQRTRSILESSRAILEQLRGQYAILGGLGAQIRNVSTFLLLLNGEMGVIHNQQKLMVLFSPLLESVNSLVTFLEGNANMIVLIGDRDALSKIRQHLSQNVLPALGN